MSEQAFVCARCTAALRSGAVFCPSCGLRAGETLFSEPPQSLPPSASEAGWRELRPALVLFAAMLAVSFTGMVAYKINKSPWNDVFMSVVTALLVTAFAVGDRQELRPLLGRFQRRLPPLGTVLVLATSIALVTGYFALLRKFGVPFLRHSDDMLKAGWPLWTVFVSVSVYPAIFEELAFRGIILTRLQKTLSATEAEIVQAAMFSVLHALPMIFPSHFVLGFLFGWLRVRSGSLYPSMLAHAAWNAWIVWSELAQQ